MNTKSAIALCALLLATPAGATNYVINLDTGNYASITASAIINDGPTTPTVLDNAGPVVPVTQTPLPGTLILFSTGLGTLGLLGWRRKKAAAV
jgi:hypothetical protein